MPLGVTVIYALPASDLLRIRVIDAPTPGRRGWPWAENPMLQERGLVGRLLAGLFLDIVHGFVDIVILI